MASLALHGTLSLEVLLTLTLIHKGDAQISLKVICEKVKNSNCGFYNNFRDNVETYV